VRARDVLRRGLFAGVGLAVAAAAIPGIADSAVAAPGAKQGSDSLWSKTEARPKASDNGHQRRVNPSDYTAYTLDGSGMDALLSRAPMERKRGAVAGAGITVSVPAPNGDLVDFAVEESPIMESGLAAKHPEITTYAGRSIADGSVSIRLDVTPMGFHASVRGADGQGAWYVDPAYNGDDSLYLSYMGADLPELEHPLVEGDVDEDAVANVKAARSDAGPEVQLRTYRLALLTDPSYARYFGTQNVLAEKVTLMNRVDQIYNDDLAIRMILINDEDKLNLDTDAKATGTNGPCGAAACFTPAQVASCGSSTLSRNRVVLGQLVGARNFDIGHIGLGVNGGGIASLGVVGGNSKAQGCTGIPQPEGDYYAIDYVAHEMGHQFSGNHTFNGNQYNCSTSNRNAGTSVEPGSGSSVMAYAGICQQDNLQPHSDPYFSQRTIQEVTTYTSSARAAINEVQTVSLRDFADVDEFTLGFGGQTTAPIVRGTNYTTTGIKAALEAILPAGSTVTVAAWGGSGSLADTGFQVTFNGALAGQETGLLTITPTVGVFSGFVGETAHGGAIQNGGLTQTPTGNHAPSVTAPASKVIPLQTPFALTATGGDADAEPITYMWEQNDVGNTGTSGGAALVNQVKTSGPLFRVFGKFADVSPAGTMLIDSPGENLATGNPTRTFPDMDQILVGNTNAATGKCPDAPAAPATGGKTNVPQATVECLSEWMPTADYVGNTAAGNSGAEAGAAYAYPSLDFRVTVRDSNPNGGGTSYDQVKLYIDKTAGPLQVTARATDGTAAVAGRTEAVTWAVNGTDKPELAPNVKISLSADGGKTFPYVLAQSVPNNGTANVTWPNISTSHARIKVEAVDNYFFDVNHADFSIRGMLDASDVSASTMSAAYGEASANPVTFTAKSGVVAKADDIKVTATGLPAGLSLTRTSATDATESTPVSSGAWTVSGKVSADVVQSPYPVTVTIDDGSVNAPVTRQFSVDVTPQAATVAYTGDTSFTNESTDPIEVPLSAKVTSGAGDLSTAEVTFTDTATGDDLCTTSADTDGVASCSIPVDTSGDDTSYAVAVEVAGNYTGETSSDTTVTVGRDRVAPDTSITSGPAHGSILTSRSAALTASSTKAGSTFACDLDGKAVACPSGTASLTKLAPGTHVFSVVATDKLGNVDASPATRTFTVPATDRGLTWVKGPWQHRKAANAYDGTFFYSNKSGAILSYKVARANRVALVVGKHPGYGSLKVYLGGKLLKTISLNAKSASSKQVVTIASFAKPASGTVKIVTGQKKPVRVEGIAVVTTK